MASFVMPEVQDNESGWGPTPDSCPDSLKHLPFAPFSKSDRLGRACEWSATRERDRRWQKNRQEEPSPFVYEQVDEEGFHLVDTKTTAKPKWGPGARRGPMGQPGRGGRGGFGNRDWQERGRDGQSVQKAGDRFANQKDPRSRWGPRGGRGGGRGFDNWRDKPQRVRVSSVEVKPEWTPLDGQAAEDFTMSLPQMEKLRSDEDVVPEDLAMVGSLFLVDKTIDKASVRSSISLRKVSEPKPYHIAVMDDPIIKKLAAQGKGNVFTTDIALAVLMAAPRSVNSWDMVVQRAGDALFLDVRDGSSVYETTVNETAVDAPDDEQKDSNINSMSALYAEASCINFCFLQQCLSKQQPPVNTENGDKGLRESWAQRGADIQVPAGKSYRYRRWELSEELTLVVRCEVDAALRTRDDSLAYITIKALNEFDSKISGIDWRQKLESQKAAVLANELKNNRNKLARWTCQALIAGADYMKVGFVSRHHSKDPNTHFVLGQQLYKPEEFAKQIELKQDNAWGIVTNVLGRLMQLPAQTDDPTKVPSLKYLMVKDPNKPHINFYTVPADAFDYDQEDEDREKTQNRDDDHDSDFE